MILLKKGPGKQPWKGKCSKCENEYSAEKDELTTTDVDREGPFGYKKCPNCTTIIYFYPPNVLQRQVFGPRSEDC